MSKRQSNNQNRPGNIKKLILHIITLSSVLGLIIWHTVVWHNNGTHETMLAWIGTEKVYLLILYNLALMLITGTLLGIMMGKITGLFSYYFAKR
jgi:uncharacterized membrane protein